MSKEGAAAGAGEGLRIEVIPPSPRNGKRDDAQPVKQLSEAEKRRELLEDRLASIVESVGSAGGATLRCWNVDEHGAHDSWAASLPIAADDPALEDLEAFLASKLGGGRYYVRPFVRGKGLGVGATVTIDPNRFPKIERKKEDPVAAAVAKPSPDGVGMRDFMLMLEQQRRDADNARRDADARIQQIQANQQAESNKMLGLLIASMSDSQRAIVAIASGGKQGGGDMLEQVSKVAKLAEVLGWAPAGSSGAAASDTPLTEKMLAMTLPRIADKVGEAFASKMKEDAAPAPTMRPALAANGSTPAADAKQSVQETKADLLQKPAPSETKLPAGARLMKPGDVQRTKPGTRTAPTVGQAIPEAAK